MRLSNAPQFALRPYRQTLLNFLHSSLTISRLRAHIGYEESRSLMLSLILQQSEPVSSRSFDPDVVWQVFAQLGTRFLAHLPYLILGAAVFLVFVVLAHILKRILLTAGRRTRLDLTLADLLGRLASALTIVLGLFVAAVVIFDAGIEIPYPHTVVLQQNIHAAEELR